VKAVSSIPALTRLVDEGKLAEPANPLVRRQLGALGLAGAGGKGEQVPQRYRAFRRDDAFQWSVRIGEHGHVRQFREEVVDWVVETQRAVLDQRHRAGCDDRLRHRGNAEDRVGCHRRS
jgi:hypothetical protein